MPLPFAPLSLRFALVALGSVGVLAGAYYAAPGLAAEVDTAWALAVGGDAEGLAAWFAKFGAFVLWRRRRRHGERTRAEPSTGTVDRDGAVAAA